MRHAWASENRVTKEIWTLANYQLDILGHRFPHYDCILYESAVSTWPEVEHDFPF